MYVYHTFFIPYSVNKNLGCFFILATVSDAAMNLFKLVFCFIFGRYPEIKLLCHMVTLSLDI